MPPDRGRALSRRDNKTMICPECGTREALQDFKAAMFKQEKPRVTYSLRMSPELWQKVQKSAYEKDVSVNHFIVTLLEAFVNEGE